MMMDYSTTSFLNTRLAAPPTNPQGYIPNLAGNAFFCGLFALLFLIQCYQAVRYRTYGFSIGLICGLVLEVIGYAARIKMHFLQNGFLAYIVTITIGPAFIAAGVYLCLARIIVAYGQHFSRFAPRVYTITFMISDFLALLLQAAGGGIAGQNNREHTQTGIDILLTGLSVQVVSMTIFIAMAGDFAFSAWKGGRKAGKEWYLAGLVASKRFRGFLICLTFATTFIYIRTIFRVAELSQGFDSALSENEVDFMVLEGAMMSLACILLTVAHPGFAFQGLWKDADFSLGRGDKRRTRDAEAVELRDS